MTAEIHYQSNYYDQSQQEQTVRRTNQNSKELLVTCLHAREKSRVQGAIGFGFAY